MSIQPRVLVVDESWYRRWKTCQTVRRLPAEVVAVPSAARALHWLAIDSFDAVVVNRDGAQLDAEKLRQQMLFNPNVPTLPMISTRWSASNPDTNDFYRTLNAPFHDLELLAALTDLIRNTPAGASLPLRPHRFLIVDDEAHERTKMISVLWSAGYQIEAARSGGEALTILKARPPDILVLDHWMPEMNGFDVLRSLPTNPKLSGMKTIILTKTAAGAEVFEGWQLGVDCSLTKPFTSLELRTFVHRLLTFSSDPAARNLIHLG